VIKSRQHDEFEELLVVKLACELRDGPLTFRALQDACGGLSPSVLNGRLGELRETALIDTQDGSYALTALGRELQTQFTPLTIWAEKWAKAIG
jgi:DNA-binding HxlR family transcriptional regulator